VPKRILIVDDEAAVVDLLREGLVAAGYAVDGVATGAAALALVRDNLYDAAVLDFVLPDMNGVMLHSRIRQLDGDLARNTVFISGQTQQRDDLEYYRSAGGGFLSKPFELRDVVETIREMTEGPD
jgi:DNA-binding response OmpR family regulator